jgi:hypothetical protein
MKQIQLTKTARKAELPAPDLRSPNGRRSPSRRTT